MGGHKTMACLSGIGHGKKMNVLLIQMNVYFSHRGKRTINIYWSVNIYNQKTSKNGKWKIESNECIYFIEGEVDQKDWCNMYLTDPV